MYVTEIKEQPIFKRIRWQLRIFESVFYKSLIRACSFGNPRCEPKCPQPRSDIQPQALRICKKRTQKVLMFATGCFQIFVFLLFLSHTAEVYSNHYGVCMFYCIGIYNKHCLSLQKLKNDNTQHTPHLNFSIL